MQRTRENWAAIIVADIAFFLFGWAWYAAFGTAWMAAIQRTLAQTATYGWVPYLVSVIAGLLVAYALANVLSYSGEHTPARGAMLGLFLGVCLYAAEFLVQNMYEGLPINRWLIDSGYVVVGMMIMGAIIGAWKPKPAA